MTSTCSFQLTDEAIKEFLTIHEKETGETLSWAEAEDAAKNLMQFFIAISEK
jgi:hypothetical protein